jgi:hypothetical protein
MEGARSDGPTSVRPGPVEPKGTGVRAATGDAPPYPTRIVVGICMTRLGLPSLTG